MKEKESQVAVRKYLKADRVNRPTAPTSSSLRKEEHQSSGVVRSALEREGTTSYSAEVISNDCIYSRWLVPDLEITPRNRSFRRLAISTKRHSSVAKPILCNRPVGCVSCRELDRAIPSSSLELICQPIFNAPVQNLSLHHSY